MEWEGKIENAEFLENGNVRITAEDFAKVLKKTTIPISISSTNTLQANITDSATSITVDDGDEFQLLTIPRLFAAELSGSDYTFRSTHIGEWIITTSFTITLGADQANGFSYNSKTDEIYLTEYDGVNNKVFVINRRTKSFSSSSAAGVEIIDTTYDADTDTLWGTDGATLFTIDPATSIITSVGAHGAAFITVQGIAYDAESKLLFGVNCTANCKLVEISITTGAVLQIIGILGTVAEINTLVFNPIERRLYTSIPSGTSAVVGTAIVGTATVGASTFDLYEISHVTGIATLLANGVIGPMEYIPEPQTTHIRILDDTNGNEFCQLFEINDNVLTIARGKFGETAVAHTLGDKVVMVAVFTDENDIGVIADLGENPFTSVERAFEQHGKTPWIRINKTEFESERSIFLSGISFRRIVLEPLLLEEFVAQYSLLINGNFWQEENQQITGRVLHAVNPHDTSISITSEANIIDRANQVNFNFEGQYDAVLIFFDPKDTWGLAAKFDKASEFNDNQLITGPLFDPRTPDKNKILTVFAPQIFRKNEAVNFGAKFLRRHGTSALLYEIEAVRKDNAIKVGSIIDVNSKDFVNDDATDGDRNMQVQRKQPIGNGKFGLFLQDTGLNVNEAIFAHGTEPPFTSASDFDKTHSFFSKDDKNMSDGQPGYVFG